ncbi:chitin synthase [Halteromyces radiatus]|uniref:chitin synthase n=1 Tax=Halteromyces radiatus TaxID=101107 RepID=UPI00221FD237|nr:chitin synthase [Halteromyces radiatus]KAI8096834.1 chitin synthase [Halteromyces radiatus]
MIMAFVGFLTFGFTQAVCPTPPLSVQGGQVNSGYLIINGWAYLLADWNGHPAAPPNINASSNILYPPINAGGYDATFLFQDQSTAGCSNVLTPKNPSNVPEIYFPCRLFNPNQTIAPDPATFTNTSGCHLSSAARSMFHQFVRDGVPNNKHSLTKAARVYYSWENIKSSKNMVAYNGDILNLELLKSLPTNIWNIPANGLISHLIQTPEQYSGKDISHLITSNRVQGSKFIEEARCLSAIIKVGSLDTLSIGCISSDIVLYVSLVVILGVIGTKFGLAMIFGWCLSWKLGNFKEGSSYSARMKREAEIENWAQNMSTSGPLSKPRINSMYFGNNMNNKRKSLFPQTSRFTQPKAGSTRFDTEKVPTTVWKTPTSALEGFASRQSTYFGSSSPSVRFFGESSPRRSSISSDFNSGDSSSSGSVPCPFPLSPRVLRQPSADYMPFNFPLVHTVCLVTCYSEGEEGLRTTLDSIATSDYPNSHKVILVICDGIITGSGNSRSTPDICVSMMRDLVMPEHQVRATHYVAIADGSRRNNMAKVYAGFYKYDDNTIDPSLQQRVPMVTIVKCGTPEEASTSKKPGNRGKRDSQIILMQFMQKVMFDERMTTMEYEFFNSLWRVTGVPPDQYEICLMVDADTKLYPDALSRLISCAVKDPEISGMCGETKIANKMDSWVTMIQVFEYYISHHQSKAFESIFGIVTCLPGCFCMYRIKSPKGPPGHYVPILANPDIVEHYSENVVDTLHKKNLLLLGEDRYLSTLMLKTFPNRKMMFVPQAVCKTVVPDTFSVLLSQRRRWINSTIHNLMELLFVHDLCGTFCFSMQFVVFMELVGTLALPAAISFTLYLVIMACIGQPAVLPLILLALILGLPAVLIVMTSRKVVYVCWMLVYLISLPIWNFVLPVYAYWHFDDFSWGDTRKVEGSDKKQEAKGHGDKDGEFDSSKIIMKKWSDYEKDRRIQIAMERNLPLPRFMERPRNNNNYRYNNYYGSKTGSAGSSSSDAPLTHSQDTDGDISDLPLQQQQQQQQQQQPYRHDQHSQPNGIRLRSLQSDNNHYNSNSGDYHSELPSNKPLPQRAQSPLQTINKTTTTATTNMIAKPTPEQQRHYLSPTMTTGSHPQWLSTTTTTWADPAPHHQTDTIPDMADRPLPPPHRQ